MVKKSLIVLFRYFLILPNRNETKRNYRNTEIYRNSSVSVVHCEVQETVIGKFEVVQTEIGAIEVFEISVVKALKGAEDSCDDTFDEDLNCVDDPCDEGLDCPDNLCTEGMDFMVEVFPFMSDYSLVGALLLA